MAQAREQQLKRKLQTFLQELPKFGAVKGFRYFATYIRGREELIISVINEPGGHDATCHQMDQGHRSTETARRPSHSSSFTSGNLPYDKESLLMSRQTQRVLSRLGEQGAGLPPASPSDQETAARSDNQTVFLLAGYGRYSCPYVWVRSNHARLVRLTGEASEEKDSPLKLKSTKAWQDQDIQIWDIVAEMVKLCTYPAPLNPFAVDWEYFDSLSLTERLLASAAMASLLQKVILLQKKDKSYTAKVLEDLEHVTKRHFLDLAQLARSDESFLGRTPADSLSSSFASSQHPLASGSQSLEASQNEQQFQQSFRKVMESQKNANWNNNNSNSNNSNDARLAAADGKGEGIWYAERSQVTNGCGNVVKSYQYKTGML